MRRMWFRPDMQGSVDMPCAYCGVVIRTTLAVIPGKSYRLAPSKYRWVMDADYALMFAHIKTHHRLDMELTLDSA